jgi:hypothetical protein
MHHARMDCHRSADMWRQALGQGYPHLGVADSRPPRRRREREWLAYQIPHPRARGYPRSDRLWRQGQP